MVAREVGKLERGEVGAGKVGLGLGGGVLGVWRGKARATARPRGCGFSVAQTKLICCP